MSLLMQPSIQMLGRLPDRVLKKGRFFIQVRYNGKGDDIASKGVTCGSAVIKSHTQCPKNPIIS